MKNIVGLDLGTNSIGWAVVNGSVNDDGSEQLVKIQASGSRIYKPQNKMFHFCKTFCSKITLVNTIQNVI